MIRLNHNLHAPGDSHVLTRLTRDAFRALPFFVSMGALLTVAACGPTLDRLEQVGSQPAMSAVANPTAQPDYKPVTWPLPETPPPGKQYANSLWQPGARAFYRDQRANRVGDILRVRIEIDEKAELDNSTNRSRQTQERVAAPDIYGLEGKLGDLTPGTPNPSSLFNITGSTQNDGEGQIRRKERIETQVAALVTQVLPNGNLVISGKQEVRVNFELREISIQGVVRAQDIGSDNTIDSTQVAEARIVYGGRGQVMDVQQPRIGTQIIDVLSPF